MRVAEVYVRVPCANARALGWDVAAVWDEKARYYHPRLQGSP